MSSTFLFFFLKRDESWPSSDVLGGEVAQCVSNWETKSAQRFSNQNSSKFWGGFEALPNRLRSVAIWRRKSVEWCNY